MLTLTFAVALSQAAAGVAPAESAIAKGSTTMTASEIRAHNANFERDDPQYIRCVRSLVTGSLVKKHTSCRTNAEWRLKDDLGNKEAQDFIDDAKMGGTRGT